MNPNKFKPMNHYIGKVISNEPFVKLITAPKFEPANWPDCLDGIGRWTALAQVNRSLCYIEVKVKWEEYHEPESEVH